MITIALSFHYTIFLEDTKYMTILTRQERERLVIELYNQGKTYREISKEARISPRDIGVILNKQVEEKKIEGSKEQQGGAEKNQELEQQHPSLSTQAYKLFSEGKAPIQVSIALNLRESEATKFCREYWKLKQLHNLNMVYEQIKDDIAPFLKLFKLSKAKGIGVQQVVDTLAIANNDLPSIEERFKRIRNDVSMLQSQKHTCKRNLYQLNNQITSTTKLLNSFRISCEGERREIENLYTEKARLESVVTEFKNDNEDYLNKIKQTAEEKIKSVLINGKILLRFATASVIESLRRNPELCNFVLYDISNNNDTAVILEEAEKLYNELIMKLTNSVISASAAVSIRTSSLALSLTADNNNQKLNYENDTYQTEEPKNNINQNFNK
jgi:transposase